MEAGIDSSCVGGPLLPKSLAVVASRKAKGSHHRKKGESCAKQLSWEMFLRPIGSIVVVVVVV